MISLTGLVECDVGKIVRSDQVVGTTSVPAQTGTIHTTKRCHMGDLHWVISLFLGVVVSSTLILANKIKEH
ncbi:MAG: hypothetical protein ACYC9S_02515 [Leptospirales bacterium]